MKNYEKPIVLANYELSEGVFAASGTASAIKCDSAVMNGVWQAPDYTVWDNGENRGYQQQFGCLGCPANTGSGCGLLTHYEDSGYADSYEVDNGDRKPSWEKKGYDPNDPVSDWNM